MTLPTISQAERDQAKIVPVIKQMTEALANIPLKTYSIVCGGTVSTSAFQSVDVGGTGTVLTSNGPAALPSMQALPASSVPGLNYLTTLTASSSSTLDDTTHITSTYDAYQIELVNLLPTTDSTFLLMQFRVSGSFQTANYLNLLSGAYTGPGSDGPGAASETHTGGILLSGQSTGFNATSNTASYGVNGTIHLHSPNSAAFKFVTGHVSWKSDGGVELNTGQASGTYIGTTSIVTGLRFIMGTGTIASGLVRIWGIKTS